MFGEQTANKFMERWPITFKAGVIKESHGLVPSTDLLDLMRNAETSTEVEKGKSLNVEKHVAKYIEDGGKLWHNVNLILVGL